MARHQDKIVVFDDDTLYASKGQGSLVAFETRKFFKEHALKQELGDPKAIDFWYESPNHGKKDGEGNVILLSESNLKQLRTENNKTYFAIDFVADAYHDFLEAHKNAVVRGKIKEESVFSSLELKKAWISASRKYHAHLEEVYNFFILDYLVGGKKVNSIFSFGDFFNHFMNFATNLMPGLVITRTGFIGSNLCSPLVSGMILEFAQHDHNQDERKRTEYIEDPSFKYFRYLARQHGFLLDKNAPWRLVANPGAKTMLKYAKKYGIEESVEDFYDFYFYKTYQQDTEILKKYFMYFYNSFVESYPYSSQTSVSPSGTTSLFRGKKRHKITEDMFNDNFGELFWLKTFYQLRAMESDFKWSEVAMNKEAEKALELFSSLDKDAALRYINRRTRA